MKERSIKELLQLMLDNQHCFNGGLCKWVIKLYYFKLITFTELLVLKEYIMLNRPSMFSSFEGFKWRFSRGYYWKPDNIVPRIKWLLYHIKKNS